MQIVLYNINKFSNKLPGMNRFYIGFFLKLSYQSHIRLTELNENLVIYFDINVDLNFHCQILKHNICS